LKEQPIRVLLVEDNPGDARLIEEMLKESTSLPCTFFHIDSLFKIEDLTDERFDVLLLDLHFDTMTGLETYNYAQAYFSFTPIVVLTGLRDERLAYEIVKQGAQDYLLKDAIEPKGLVRSIRYAIERKKAQIQKDEFLGFASHELKTPVTSIKAYIQLMLLYAKRGQKRDVLPLIQKIDVQVDRLSHLINDLLDVTKVQAGKLEFNFENFSLNEIVDEVISDMQLTTSKHQIVKEGSVKAYVYGDRARTAQILINLLSNAIKYSPQADLIMIRVNDGDDKVRVAVQDFGIGIAKEYQQKIFDRFYRVDGKKQETYPGLGLGLHIASEIAKRQNGRLSVESEPGKGTTFHLELPSAYSMYMEKEA